MHSEFHENFGCDRLLQPQLGESKDLQAVVRRNSQYRRSYITKRIYLHALRLRRRYANPPCLAAAFFLGIPTVCLISAAFWVILPAWHTPSVQTRIRVEADLSACALEEADLPNGWHIRSVSPYDLYERVLPGRALGGIRMWFDPHEPGDDVVVTHDILLYRTPKGASSQFENLPISHNSRFYKSWMEVDLKETNLSADEYRIVCADFVPDIGPGRGDKSCYARVRYDRILSVFKAEVAPHDISIEEMLQVLQAIDRRMLMCVDYLADKEWE